MVADEEQRSLAIKALNNWQKDSDLASVRDILWVERLSEEEQLEWRQLWQSVHDLKGKAEEGN